MNKDSQIFFIIWGVFIILNQMIFFGGCFSPHCIISSLPHTGFASLFFTLYVKGYRDEGRRKGNKNNKNSEESLDKRRVETKVKEEENRRKEPPKRDKPTENINVKKEIDPLKEKGDRYERFIGKKFEEKGELVIYNGFINGYKDKGVDIISISLESKSINLIQCKNWTKKPMTLDDVIDIYEKLDNYSLRDIPKDTTKILKYLQISQSKNHINSILSSIDKNDFTIRKTLYAGSDKVMDLDIGKFLKMIQANIFRYKDMKIVIKVEKRKTP